MSDLLSVITFMGVTVALALPSLVALVIYVRSHSPGALATMEATVSDMARDLRELQQERKADHQKIMTLIARMSYLESGISVLVQQVRSLGLEPQFVPDFMTVPVPVDVNEPDLLKVLVDRFSKEELDDLCFGLNVPAEEIGGGTHSARARALVQYMRRRGNLNILADEVARLRPQKE